MKKLKYKLLALSNEPRNNGERARKYLRTKTHYCVSRKDGIQELRAKHKNRTFKVRFRTFKPKYQPTFDESIFRYR